MSHHIFNWVTTSPIEPPRLQLSPNTFWNVSCFIMFLYLYIHCVLIHQFITIYLFLYLWVHCVHICMYLLYSTVQQKQKNLTNSARQFGILNLVPICLQNYSIAELACFSHLHSSIFATNFLWAKTWATIFFSLSTQSINYKEKWGGGHTTNEHFPQKPPPPLPPLPKKKKEIWCGVPDPKMKAAVY